MEREPQRCNLPQGEDGDGRGHSRKLCQWMANHRPAMDLKMYPAASV